MLTGAIDGLILTQKYGEGDGQGESYEDDDGGEEQQTPLHAGASLPPCWVSVE